MDIYDYEYLPMNNYEYDPYTTDITCENLRLNYNKYKL